jgi:hypothetical protein
VNPGEFGRIGPLFEVCQRRPDERDPPAAGNLYVTEWGNARVQVFSPQGASLRTWGSQTGSRSSTPGRRPRASRQWGRIRADYR